MNSIYLRVSSLLKKIQTISDDDMTDVRLTLNDEVTDQGIQFPAFLHFEAFAEDGSAVDYESVDSPYSMVLSDIRMPAMHK